MSIYSPPTNNAIQKTLGAALLSGVTAAATLNNVVGIPNEPGVMVVDRVDSSGNSTASLREYIAYTGTSGSTVTGLTRNVDSGGTDQDHAVGAVVEFIFDVVQMKAIKDTFETEHNADGTHDTTKVVDLTTAQTLTNKTLTSPVLQGTVDGWISANETWTYASATTITVPSGAASKYAKGDKIKITQTTVKYFYVVGVADTLLTVTGGSDYTLVNAAITDNYYSHASNPIGFPGYINLPTASSTNARLSISGGLATVTGWYYITGNGSSQRITTIIFGITFGVAPVVTVSLIGYKDSASVPTAITEFIESNSYKVGKSGIAAHDITTTNVQFTIDVEVPANWTSSIHLGVSYIAIGKL